MYRILRDVIWKPLKDFMSIFPKYYAITKVHSNYALQADVEKNAL